MAEFDFIALDVETANMDLWSICQVGLASFKGGQLVDSWVSLIDPECPFDSLNIEIHGITPQMVEGSIKHNEMLKLMEQKLSDNNIVHHTHFDRVAFNQLSLRLGVKAIDCTWLDSSRVARYTWDEVRFRGYGLSNLASMLNISQIKPHDALDDAKTAGLILLKAIEISNKPLSLWIENSNKNYSMWGTPRHKYHELASTEPNQNGPLFGEVLVFTGALSIPRIQAASLAFNLGCNIDERVNRETTLLVVGDQDSSRLAGYQKSSKHRKAEELIAKGQPIRIINESDFLSMIQI